jgi:PhoH-like ATPase
MTDRIKKLFVLDTNVLVHDPMSIFQFKENDVYIPIVVLEELDNIKKGSSDIARNARQASRFLDDLIKDKDHDSIVSGLPLRRDDINTNVSTGTLFFQTQQYEWNILDDFDYSKNDNIILNVSKSITEVYKDKDIEVILVSKDTNVRIKAIALDIKTEDYYTDQSIDDIDLLYSGSYEINAEFWNEYSTIETFQKEGRTYYKIIGDFAKDLYINQFIYDVDSGFEGIVSKIENNPFPLTDGGNINIYVDNYTVTIKLLKNYYNTHTVWGVKAKNRGQNFALNILTDDDIDIVTLVGTAGTGKTLLALATALQGVLEDKKYNDIIVTRETISIGSEIGFLPGSESEKMIGWMGAVTDNLEMLGSRTGEDKYEKEASNSLMMSKVKILSLGLMRGRSFLNRILIIDEVQNLTPKQVKALITRCGHGTKVICLGNLSQIDNNYLTPTTSGLTYLVQRFKGCEFSAHIILTQGERSRLADYANENL